MLIFIKKHYWNPIIEYVFNCTLSTGTYDYTFNLQN